MDVTITARHCTVPDSIRDVTQRRIRRLERFRPRATSASVMFEENGARRLCEVRMMVAGGAPLVASAEGFSFRNALDEAMARLQRQLKRHRERHIRRRDSIQRSTL